MKWRTLRIRLFLLIGLTLGLYRDLWAQGCPLTQSVSLTKSVYRLHEPIEVRIRFESRTSSDRIVNLGGPFPGPPELVFTPMGSLKQSPDLLNDGGLGQAVWVPSGGVANVKVYLQRYLTGFTAGHYEIPWALQVQCTEVNGNSRASVSGAGLLRFDVSGVDDTALYSIFEDYFQSLESVSGQNRREKIALLSQSERIEVIANRLNRERTEAIDALSASPSPRVIPYLQRIMQIGEVESAYVALRKFGGNPEARQLVLDTLRTGKGSDVSYGLQVLQVWNERLPEADLRILLEKNALVTLRYMGFTRDPNYLPMIEEYTKNANPNIANEAEQARAAIGQR